MKTEMDRNNARRSRSGLVSTSLAVMTVAGLMLATAGTASAATAAGLGTATSFAVLGGSTVTNTGPSVINGDLGVSPGSDVVGFPPGQVNGTIHAADAVAAQAQSDTTTAYNDLAGQPCDTNLTDQDLGGQTLTTGVYCFDTSAQLTGDLTLDAEGSPDAVFIFQIGSTLTTASGSGVNLINGAQPCNVFWQIGSSATLGTTTDFVGNLIALTSITANTGATVQGRLLARNGATTLDSNVITLDTCDSGTTTGVTTGGVTTGITTGGVTTGETTGGITTGVTTGGETTGVTTGGITTGVTSGGVTTGVTTGGQTTGHTTGGHTTGDTTDGDDDEDTTGGGDDEDTTDGDDSDDTTGGHDDEDATGGDESGDTAGASHGDRYGQVTQVPVGGVATGDGSTVATGVAAR
jgi:hypothetical protein